MQEEVTQKTIAFSIKSAKVTAQVLQAAARKFLEARNKGKTKLHHGQQSLPCKSTAYRFFFCPVGL